MAVVRRCGHFPRGRRCRGASRRGPHTLSGWLMDVWRVGVDVGGGAKGKEKGGAWTEKVGLIQSVVDIIPLRNRDSICTRKTE